MRTITLNHANKTLQVPYMSRLEDVLPREVGGLPVLAALLNNDLVSLEMLVSMDATVEPVTLANSHGWQVYRRTLSFLLAKAIHETLPGVQYHIRNSFGNNALYWAIDYPDTDPNNLPHYTSRLKLAMQKLITDNLPIETELCSYENTIQRFADNEQWDKVHLLLHRNPPTFPLIHCGTFYDLPQGPLATRTGMITTFDLTPHNHGLILQFPDRNAPTLLQPLPPYQHLYRVYEEHVSWGDIIGVHSAGELNQAILQHRVDDIVNTVEALHEKKLAEVATEIHTRTPRPHVVLISGPSSAGKTTTAMRLCTHLRVLGYTPTLISTDNYFRGEGQNPLDEQGKPDYEHIDAMDCPRLNADINALLAGQTIHPRIFDFKLHQGRDRDTPFSLDPQRGILIIEGIHSLNPDLTRDIPNQEKFKLYVSALTQLALDRNNRISTVDNRLLRRLVRDNLFRGKTPIETLRLWPSVRRGEERWIFPYQHLADAVFNTSLDYEIPVLKTLIMPLLNTIKPNQPEYALARRLSCFLQNFVTMPYEAVPTNSILREYLGDSRLHYE